MSSSLFRKKSIDKILQDAAAGAGDGHGSGSLKKILTVRDLTFMGIAAVVGAGIFSTIGTAAFNGGPGISLLFVLIQCERFVSILYTELIIKLIKKNRVKKKKTIITIMKKIRKKKTK